MQSKMKRIMWGLLGAILLTGLFPGNTFAETRKKISSVRLNIGSEIQPGDDGDDVSVDVVSGADHYTVSEFDVTNNNGNWKVGEQPKVEITLLAEDGYYFDSMGKNKVSLQGARSEYSSQRRKDDNTTLILTIRLAKLEGDLDLENVEWKDSSTPTATWTDENGASKYQVRLYRGTSAVGDAVTVSSRTYNFSASITREGEYTFKVRAVGSSKKGDWYESDPLYVSDDDLAEIKKKAENLKNPSSSNTNNSGNSSAVNGKDGIVTPGAENGANGSWQRDGKGWWFRFSDGSYPKGGWLQIGTAWYCFDGAGYMMTGWIKASDGNYYYCNTTAGSTQGALLFNQKTPDGYWVNEKGIWVPGA